MVSGHPARRFSRWKGWIRYSLVLGLSMLLLLLFISPALASSSVVHDARGDVGVSPPYLDVVNA